MNDMQSREKTEGGMIGLFSAIGGVYISDGSTSCVEKVEMKKKRRPTPYDDTGRVEKSIVETIDDSYRLSSCALP